MALDRVLPLALGVGLGACGALSTDDDWDSDAEPPTSLPLVAHVGDTHWTGPAACPPEHIAGHHYAEPPEFWLGSQAERTVAVRGQGFLVSNDANTLQRAARFSQEALVSIAPDGSLEDHGGHALLGYPPEAIPGGPCVRRLVAPLFAPPQATARVMLHVNLDPRHIATTFDVLDPSGTSAMSTSLGIYDSLGGPRIIDVHFVNAGGNLHFYHVMADGSDVAGATPGHDVLLGSGSLQFTSDGALETETAPPVCVSFAGGATASQCVSFDFGEDITSDGGSGLSGTTAFATASFVAGQSQDGLPPGTGTFIQITPAGEVTVAFDSGAALPIGRLALARFASEDQLAEAPDGSLSATAESGPAQLGAPASPGRGTLSVAP
jgi:flagellar hook protein FlgE